MAKLGVNVDHVATVRQARKTDEPSPIWAAAEAELGGAACITAHLREDRRHINDDDMALLRKTVTVKFNMEMSLDPGIVRAAQTIKPDQCTLVPEHRKELTTEGGLDVVGERRRCKLAVGKLKKAGATLSAFIEPVENQIRASADAGFDAIELWTGDYSHTRRPRQATAALLKLKRAVQLGLSLGLEVHGGHGLTYRNIEPVARIEGFSEFNIGHSIVARAIFSGFRDAVREMNDLLILYSPFEEDI